MGSIVVITISKCFFIRILFQLMLILVIDQQNSGGHDQLLSSVHVSAVWWYAVSTILRTEEIVP